MKTVLSIGDFVDIYHKIRLNGFKFLSNRLLGLSRESKVKRTWSCVDKMPSEWWMISNVQKRWNRIITGDPNMEYPEYLVKKYLKNKSTLRMLSPGCGSGVKEIRYAKYDKFKLIEAFDISGKNISEAKENALKSGYDNINFFVENTHKFDFGFERYDLVVFDSSLHHLDNVETVLDKVRKALKNDGLLVISEYVGPNLLQWRSDQLKTANNLLKSLPTKYRKRLESNSLKSKIYRPGTVRMFFSDPSEAVDSENILPAIRKKFVPLEEKMLGGNIINLLLKDISHNFINEDQETNELLEKLFQIEDEFIDKKQTSDFVFGVYKKIIS